MIHETSIIKSESVGPLMKDLKDAGIASTLENRKLRIAAGVGTQSDTMKEICKRYGVRVGFFCSSKREVKCTGCSTY